MLAETNKFMAFLDYMPRTRGHTLVIPKKHYRWADDVPEFGEYFEFARKVAEAIRKALDPEKIQYITIGEMIPHAHIQVVPRYNNDKHGILPDYSKVENYSTEEMKEIEVRIKTAYSK